VVVYTSFPREPTPKKQELEFRFIISHSHTTLLLAIPRRAFSNYRAAA